MIFQKYANHYNDHKQQNWLAPEIIADYIAHSDYSNNDWVYLASSDAKSYSGRYSFIGILPKERIYAQTDDYSDAIKQQLAALREKLNNSNSNNYYFGYFSYEAAHIFDSALPSVDIEQFIAITHKSPAEIPPIDHPYYFYFLSFELVIRFDHKLNIIEYIDDKNADLLQAIIEQSRQYHKQQKNYSIDYISDVTNISSNLPYAQYLGNIKRLLQAIYDGECYQANLTRKFWGQINYDNSNNIANHNFPYHIFTKLMKSSPAPYSAYMKLAGRHIICSSPERFLEIDDKGNIESRPIKGSIARIQDNMELDLAQIAKLKNSSKDRAENIMITDLMRNDLSKIAEKGSVNVPKLCELQSYNTIHHLDSQICAMLAKQYDLLDVIAACFPAGSMTGAPKRKAMEWCAKLESSYPRGIYSGALGWLASDGSADLAVIIRTIIMQETTNHNNKDNISYNFELQTGGGIVADSLPEAEWQELCLKAKPMLKALGIGMDKFESV